MPPPPAPQRQQQRQQAPPARAWYLDALSAIAFFLLALTLVRGVKNVFGPIGGLFFFVICAGMGWFHARAAWRNLLERRG